jgi:hypothetical protein
MAENTPPGAQDLDKYKKAIKLVNQLTSAQEKNEESMKRQRKYWDDISQSIFGISSSQFFEKVPKTTEDLIESQRQISKIKDELNVAAVNLDKVFGASLSSIGTLSDEAKNQIGKYSEMLKQNTEMISGNIKEMFNVEDIQKNRDAVSDILSSIKQLSKEGRSFDEIQESIGEKYKEQGIKLGEFEKYYNNIKEIKEAGEKQYEKELSFLNGVDSHLKGQVLETLAGQKQISDLIKEQGDRAVQVLMSAENLPPEIKKMVDELNRANKSSEALIKDLSDMQKEVVNYSKMWESWSKNVLSISIKKLTEFDNIIHDTQKTSGIMFTQNEAAMTNLVTSTAQFGMSMQETAGFMAALGDELRTTDFGVLSRATEDLKAVQLATGASAENLGTMSGEMMRMGMGSEKVKDFMADANLQAKAFGVNSKKVIENISKNITKMRTMGFTGGIESLKKMAAQAERMGQNLDEMFDMSKRARGIEGAMNMAAELQLAGGSFANINPMDLLAKARKGPAELQKLLAQMGKDIGRYNEKGEFEIDPVDADRLQIVSEATGLSMDTLTKSIQKNAEDVRKADWSPNLEGIKVDGLDDDAIKAQISDAMELKDGEIKVKEGNIFGAKNIDELKNMSKEDIAAKLKQFSDDKKNLEKQALQNQSLEKSFTAMKDSLMNMLTIFQPIIDGITWVVQQITKLIQLMKGSVVGKVILALIGLTVIIGAMFPLLIGAIGKMAFAFNPANMGKIFKAGGIGKAMGKSDDISKNISDSEKGGGAVGETKSGGGLKSLAEGLKAMGDKDVFKGILAVALAGPALILFLPAIPGLIVLAAVGSVKKLVVSGFEAIAEGFGVMGKNFKDVLMGSVAIAIVGAALGVFALSLGLFSKIEWGTLLMAGVSLLGLVGTLALVGMIVAGPGGLALLMGAGALVLIAASLALTAVSLIVFAKGMSALSTVDWNSFSGIGPALLGVSTALGAFAMAGLMFVNPIMLAGMTLMISSLYAISLVLMPLAESLDLGGKGLDSMATGVMKLSDSLQKLDFEKLDKLKEFSSEMASAASGGAIAESLSKLADSLGFVSSKSSGGAGTSSKPIIVQLKMPDGRMVQQTIIDDVNKVS